MSEAEIRKIVQSEINAYTQYTDKMMGLINDRVSTLVIYINLVMNELYLLRNKTLGKDDLPPEFPDPLKELNKSQSLGTKKNSLP